MGVDVYPVRLVVVVLVAPIAEISDVRADFVQPQQVARADAAQHVGTRPAVGVARQEADLRVEVGGDFGKREAL